MVRDEHTAAGQIKAAIALVFSRVAKKNIEGGSRCQFVRSNGGEVRIASTAEDTQVGVGRVGAIES